MLYCMLQLCVATKQLDGIQTTLHGQYAMIHVNSVFLYNLFYNLLYCRCSNESTVVLLPSARADRSCNAVGRGRLTNGIIIAAQQTSQIGLVYGREAQSPYLLK